MAYRLILLIAVLVAVGVQGEGNPKAVPGPGVRPAGQSQVPTVQVFDNRIFDASESKSPPQSVTSPRSNRTRFIDRSLGEYNTDQVKRWQNTCSPQKDNPQQYNECFKKAREESLSDNQRDLDRVERKQNKPLRTVPFRIPSVGGEDD